MPVCSGERFSLITLPRSDFSLELLHWSSTYFSHVSTNYLLSHRKFVLSRDISPWTKPFLAAKKESLLISMRQSSLAEREIFTPSGNWPLRVANVFQRTIFHRGDFQIVPRLHFRFCKRHCFHWAESLPLGIYTHDRIHSLARINSEMQASDSCWRAKYQRLSLFLNLKSSFLVSPFPNRWSRSSRTLITSSHTEEKNKIVFERITRDQESWDEVSWNK